MVEIVGDFFVFEDFCVFWVVFVEVFLVLVDCLGGVDFGTVVILFTEVVLAFDSFGGFLPAVVDFTKVDFLVGGFGEDVILGSLVGDFIA